LLGLVDDLLHLEVPDGLTAVRIEVEADGFAVSVSRHGQAARVTTPTVKREEAPVEKTQRVHATPVGMFTAAREWATGAPVARVSRAERERYGSEDVADLVRRSFEFLLAREPNNAILREFDLSTIERYFPEYAREIRRS